MSNLQSGKDIIRASENLQSEVLGILESLKTSIAAGNKSGHGAYFNNDNTKEIANKLDKTLTEIRSLDSFKSDSPNHNNHSKAEETKATQSWILGAKTAGDTEQQQSTKTDAEERSNGMSLFSVAAG